MVYYFLFITLKKHFKPNFFILKAFKDIFQDFKFVNWRIGGLVAFLMSRTGNYYWSAQWCQSFYEVAFSKILSYISIATDLENLAKII